MSGLPRNRFGWEMGGTEPPAGQHMPRVFTGETPPSEMEIGDFLFMPRKDPADSAVEGGRAPDVAHVGTPEGIVSAPWQTHPWGQSETADREVMARIIFSTIAATGGTYTNDDLGLDYVTIDGGGISLLAAADAILAAGWHL